MNKELRIKRLRQAIEIADRLQVQAHKDKNRNKALYYHAIASTHARELSTLL